MTKPTFSESRDAKAAGWFSRRHQTSDAHREATAKYHEEHGKQARRRRAEERTNPDSHENPSS